MSKLVDGQVIVRNTIICLAPNMAISAAIYQMSGKFYPLISLAVFVCMWIFTFTLSNATYEREQEA